MNLFNRKIYYPESNHIEITGQEISYSDAKKLVKSGYAVWVNKILRKVVKIVKEDRELFSQVVKLARDKGYKI